MKTNFKVGDKVWDDVIVPGVEGVVAEIKRSNFSVLVLFGSNEEEYNFNGGYYDKYKPTLSKVPYIFEVPEQPLEFEEGDPVLVRNHKEYPWFGAKFVKHTDENGDYKFTTDGQRSWRYCIPFDIEKMGRV